MLANKSDLIEGEVTVIEYFIRSKGLIFDVGAYTGEWSDIVLERFPDITIHQFEPALDSFEQLSKNCADQVEIGRVVQNNCIVSNVEGFVPFYYYSNQPVLSTVYRRNKTIEERFKLDVRIEMIPSTTLDAYCELKGIHHIDFLKIDTEGGEYDVLKGSRALLENQAIDCIQFEYGGCFMDSNITLKEVFDYLTSFGYRVFKISSDGLSEITEFTTKLESYVYCNFLAILV